MSNQRRRDKKDRARADGAAAELMRRMRRDCTPLDRLAQRHCRCCEGEATWLCTASGEPWCGFLVCLTVDSAGRLTTRPRDAGRVEEYRALFVDDEPHGVSECCP